MRKQDNLRSLPRSGRKLVIEANEAESQMSDGPAARDTHTVLGEISESLSLPGASSEGGAPPGAFPRGWEEMEESVLGSGRSSQFTSQFKSLLG